jgi:molybdenum cofactor cytidylyltransferase
VSAAHRSGDHAPVAGVVLAAGASRRMGTPKAGLRFAGQTFLAHVITALENGGVGAIAVVAGEAIAAVQAALPAGRASTLLRNPAPERGQLSSLKIALAHVRQAHPEAAAIVVALVDHPAVRASTVAALLAAAESDPTAAIVLPEHAARRGHPVLFGRTVWQELLDTSDDLGARAVVRADPGRVRVVPVDDPGILVDVDTPDDLQALLKAAPIDRG